MSEWSRQRQCERPVKIMFVQRWKAKCSNGPNGIVHSTSRPNATYDAIPCQVCLSLLSINLYLRLWIYIEQLYLRSIKTVVEQVYFKVICKQICKQILLWYVQKKANTPYKYTIFLESCHWHVRKENA